MKILLTSTVAALVLIATASVYAQQGVLQVPNDVSQVPRISQDEFVKRITTGDMVILDVRKAEEYRAGHIPGALSMPLQEILERWKELPKDKLIVTYCS